MARSWSYYFTVDHAHDGDTILGDLDLGLDLWFRHLRVRVAGVDAPELGDSRPDVALVAQEAAQAVDQLCPAGTILYVESVRYDEYHGRIDANVILPDGRSLATIGLEAKWLRPYSGRGPKPW